MDPVLGSRSSAYVVFVGPFGVGKSTAVRTVSDSRVAGAEAASSLAGLAGTSRAKTTTTVGLEYGEWNGPRGPVGVIGTPSQRRFEVVRRSLLPLSTSVVLWVFGHHEEAVADCRGWFDLTLAEGVDSARLTIAVTRLREERVLEQCAAAVGDAVPVLAADPRDRHDVERVTAAALDRLPVGGARR